MLEKAKSLWNTVKEKSKALAAKLPKSNPDVTVTWNNDGQPEFKNKKEKKTKK